MMFNLLSSEWLEVRRASGARAVISPAHVTDDFDRDPIVALDFDRPDWNAALTEFLIGLVYLTGAPEDAEAWEQGFTTPPSPTALSAAFAPVSAYFDVDTEGAAAFQDLDLLAKAELKPLSSLLIEAPGEQTQKNNADLFNKRGAAKTLSLGHAAAALITLQTYAPSGGAGHRTSMRGGGPLTTLLAPVRAGEGRATTLWDRIWANVPDADDEHGCQPKAALPWLSPTVTSEKESALITPEGQHPALAFFACPRRIRLVFDEGEQGREGEGRGEGGRVAVGFRTLNYGANYQAWQHPLSPYYEDKKSGRLPLHPHAGASDYGDWLAWLGVEAYLAKTKRYPAQVVQLWPERRAQIQGDLAKTLIEVFGYDMDNMKARQWLDAHMPWINAHEAAMRGAVARLIAGSDAAAQALRYMLKLAVHGQTSGGGYRLPDTLNRDALSEPAERFWRETQAGFEALLDQLATHLHQGPEQTASLIYPWRDYLRRTALRIFDQTLDLDALTDQDPHRLLYARAELRGRFGDQAKDGVLQAMGLRPPPKPAKTKAPDKQAV